MGQWREGMRLLSYSKAHLVLDCPNICGRTKVMSAGGLLDEVP